MRFSKNAVGIALFLATCFVLIFVLMMTIPSWPSEDDGVRSGGVEVQISPTPSPSSTTTEVSAERFQGGCPPDGAVTGGEVVTSKLPQKINTRLLDLMQEEVEDSLGETHRFVQRKAFCLFTDDG